MQMDNDKAKNPATERSSGMSASDETTQEAKHYPGQLLRLQATSWSQGVDEVWCPALEASMGFVENGPFSARDAALLCMAVAR